jgi:hypothetical protein
VSTNDAVLGDINPTGAQESLIPGMGGQRGFRHAFKGGKIGGWMPQGIANFRIDIGWNK